MEISDLKDIARDMFLLSLLALGVAAIIRLSNPFMYPRLEERLIWVCFILGIITAIFYFSHEFSIYRKKSVATTPHKKMPFGGKPKPLKRRNFLITRLIKLCGNLRNIICLKLGNLRNIIYKGLDNLLERYRGMDKETMARLLFRQITELMLVAYLSFMIVRILSVNFALFIDSNYLLLSILLIGLITVIFPPKKDFSKKASLKKTDYKFVILAGFIGSVLIWYRMKELGSLSYIMATFVGIIIILLSLLALEED
jgi:hypothetical protein